MAHGWMWWMVLWMAVAMADGTMDGKDSGQNSELPTSPKCEMKIKEGGFSKSQRCRELKFCTGS